MIFVRDFLGDQQLFRAAGASAAPLVSVIMPTYRRCSDGRLQRAIASVLDQNMEDFELLVIDDGSTDGTREVVLALQASDPRILYVRHEANCGLPALRVDEGIELSRGTLVAFQFDDDRWQPGTLDALVRAADTHPQPAIVCGTAVLHFPDGRRWTLPGTTPVNAEELEPGNFLANNSVLVPRVMFDRYGMYDPHLAMRRLCDWDLWRRFVRHVPFVAIEHVVSEVHVASDDAALGVTVPMDLPLFRHFSAIARGDCLTPARWREWQVDATEIGEIAIPEELRQRFVEQQLLPYAAARGWTTR